MGSGESEYPTRIIVEDEEAPMEAFTTRNRCCCFPSSSSTASLWERIRAADSEDRWWGLPLRAIIKLREWSEIVAGPKWKTFIRRFNRHRNRHQSKFQYDPLSYSLNFDEGQSSQFDEDSAHFPDFSTRFAAVPLSAQSSMDLSKAVPLG